MDMLAYVRQALDDEQRGLSLPFAIIDNATGAVVGSTRYMDIATAHRRLEIGATWLMPAFQRTAANSEAKLLLLTHAFETLDAMRGVFKTEALHEASRRALERLGATQEGVFRKHLLAASGRPRDMVYFSILEGEWPAIKAALESRLR